MATVILANMRKAEAAARASSPRRAMLTTSWVRGRRTTSAWALLSRKSGARMQGYAQRPGGRPPRYVDATPNMSDGEDETDDESSTFG